MTGKGDPTSALQFFTQFRVGPSVAVRRDVSLLLVDG